MTHLLDVISLVVVTASLAAVTIYKRVLSRQIDALRAEVALARIEVVLSQRPAAGDEEAAAPSPAARAI